MTRYELILEENENDIEFPKYFKPVLNILNHTSKATTPKSLGCQFSDMIQEFNGSSSKEWEEFIKSTNPDVEDIATNKIWDMHVKFLAMMESISKKMVREWVRDLIFTKTYVGLTIQSKIIQQIAEENNLNYRLANDEEEKKGIDGYIDYLPVSIKPKSFNNTNGRQFDPAIKIIYYTKKDNKVTFDY